MLLRLLLYFTLFFIELHACDGGYASCIAKVRDSQAIQQKQISIPLKDKKRLLYAESKPNKEILKFDPFLGLYLVKDTKAFAYPFDLNMHLQLGTAMVTKSCSREGRFTQDQQGLNNLALYSEPLLYPALLTSSCCSLEGIVTSRGIIQKEYINRFLTNQSVTYGDIGVRLKDTKKGIVVDAKDPFIENNPFKKGDIFVAFDKYKVENTADVMQKILFSSLGKKHIVEIKRNKKSLTFHVITTKRYGGGLVSDTFLESKGLFFDKELRLCEITGSFKNYGLKLGDKLIQVNGVLIRNQEELREYIENSKDYSSLLFERNGFEFFVNIK